MRPLQTVKVQTVFLLNMNPAFTALELSGPFRARAHGEPLSAFSSRDSADFTLLSQTDGNVLYH